MSKFTGLLEAAKEREAKESREDGYLSAQKAESPNVQEAEPPVAEKRGRPRGKRSDPAYDQYSVHLRKETHKAVKKALIDEEKDLSVLVEELLTRWLSSRQEGR